jgi:predicted dehydrogenase
MCAGLFIFSKHWPIILFREHVVRTESISNARRLIMASASIECGDLRRPNRRATGKGCDVNEIGMIEWGIVGAGHIAHRFAQGLAHVPATRIARVWSRRAASVDAFVQRHGGEPCGTFDELLASEVKAVYIATLNDSHADFARAALAAGKHVLCEKPAALNVRQLQTVLQTARAAQRLFMEAMKPPFFPLYKALREHLHVDPIGPVGLVRAGCSMANVPPDHPSFSLAKGGGALLDIGVYEMFLAVDWLGAPLDVQTFGRLGHSGVDTFASVHSRHESGIAQLFCGLDLDGKGDALLAGPLGHVWIHEKWWNPVRATVSYADGRVVELNVPFEGGGLNYETAHFCDLIRAGSLESPVMTHAKSLRMMSMLDDARSALGLVFPTEHD